MAAGREADDPDAVGIDMVIASAGADQLHGAAGVDQRHRQHVTVGGEPVAEDEGAEASRGEPVGHFAALEIGGQADDRLRRAAR